MSDGRAGFFESPGPLWSCLSGGNRFRLCCGHLNRQGIKDLILSRSGRGAFGGFEMGTNHSTEET